LPQYAFIADDAAAAKTSRTVPQERDGLDSLSLLGFTMPHTALEVTIILKTDRKWIQVKTTQRVMKEPKVEATTAAAAVEEVEVGMAGLEVVIHLQDPSTAIPSTSGRPFHERILPSPIQQYAQPNMARG
jgi:hypothetical protein